MSFQNKKQSGERERRGREEGLRRQKLEYPPAPRKKITEAEGTPTEESLSHHQSHVTDEGTTEIKRETCENKRRKEKPSRIQKYGSSD